MADGFLRRLGRKLDLGPGLATRLFWNVRARRRPVVLVDFQGSLGDLVSFCATLPALRERHPRCWLVLLTAPAYLELVRSTGLVDVAATQYGLVHALARRWCRPGHEYLPTEAPATPSAGKRANPPIHTALHFAEMLGVEARLDDVRIDPGARQREKMKRRLARINPERRPVIVVHTGPTWTVKEWPEPAWQNWSELVRQNLDACVVQIGTETSTSALHNHATVRLRGAIDWVNQLTVMESAALIEQARVFVGIDSGPLHLATTLGIPSVGLFGPVVGKYRAHPRARFICLAADVPCLGCHHDPAGELHWRTGCPYDIRCMRDLAPEAVFRAVTELAGPA